MHHKPRVKQYPIVVRSQTIVHRLMFTLISRIIGTMHKRFLHVHSHPTKTRINIIRRVARLVRNPLVKPKVVIMKKLVSESQRVKVSSEGIFMHSFRVNPASKYATPLPGHDAIRTRRLPRQTRNHQTERVRDTLHADGMTHVHIVHNNNIRIIVFISPHVSHVHVSQEGKNLETHRRGVPFLPALRHGESVRVHVHIAVRVCPLQKHLLCAVYTVVFNHQHLVRTKQVPNVRYPLEHVWKTLFVVARYPRHNEVQLFHRRVPKSYQFLFCFLWHCHSVVFQLCPCVFVNDGECAVCISSSCFCF
eukprot:comp8021_c0_seq1/m.3525 comp8021_c0_seq1/g.3525  ORF comp8021_c0_seq1/g.3525 comp8021_c0_seq1/m.3525 type:complete len:305 (+) comp8021_c0_seq1:457-1371(+)